ncbi:MAG: maleylpyruvate isomerase N-terminal domain-containing protein [Anaerolineae bacterium]|nr:maleylpyruvate isomerase N-terminal domain-containing protein [Anaerolineae bacterium]
MSKRIVLLQALAATPVDLRRMLKNGPDAAAHQRPSPNQWSIAHVINHLLDVEERYLARLQRVIQQENPSLPYIHPDESSYDPRPSLPDLITQFEQARAATLLFLKEQPPGAWQRPAVHQTLGPTQFRYLVQMLVDHDTQHLNQMIEIQRAHERLATGD